MDNLALHCIVLYMDWALGPFGNSRTVWTKRGGDYPAGRVARVTDNAR